ncbi:MAG TPA: CopD family protein [Candidatus Dormibacteraeota bacterium]|nr:CopD family protein [Candidatus Dormibacteraeota bacterium]
MLHISGPQWVLWVHVVAACIWIGGQVTVAAVIPLLRGRDAADGGALAIAVGRRYQAVAWPAFAALAVTGVINVGNAGLQWSHLLDSAAGRTLTVKLGLVALSGAAAAVHAFVQAPRRRSAMWSATLGSLSLLAAVVAALYGVAIAGS